MAEREQLLLDLRGEATPLALLMARAALRGLSPGGCLEIWLGSELQARDLEQITRRSGDECTVEKIASGYFRLLLVRGLRPPGRPGQTGC
jgi:TusA-related sulfurtransferase